MSALWQRLTTWHKPLAWLVALPLLAWSLSGLMHPIMARWQPSAAAMQPPSELFAPPPDSSWQQVPAIARTLAGEQALQDLRLRTWQAQPYWLAISATGERRYHDALTGAVVDIESRIVGDLARHYSGDTQSAISLTPVHAFSAEYPAVNRYLPVWRVAFDRADGLVVFIEPKSLKLAALSNHAKTAFSQFFRVAHAWSWWPHTPSRAYAMAAVLLLGALTVAAGLARWARSRHSPARSRTGVWHRRLGLALALAALAWMSTGAWHSVLMQERRGAWLTYPERGAFAATEVQLGVPAALAHAENLLLMATADGPQWYSPARPSLAIQASDHAKRDVSQFWQQLAQPVSAGAVLEEVNLVTRFDHEYGFVQKRLPVQRLRFSEGLTVYVDPVDAAIASVVRPMDRWEGFAFAYLHKSQFLDPLIGRDARDAVAGISAFGVFLLVLMGFWRYRTQR